MKLYKMKCSIKQSTKQQQNVYNEGGGGKRTICDVWVDSG